MKIALLQTDIVWRNAQANIAQAEALLAQQPGADLYVLPEMWASGFDMHPDVGSLVQSRLAMDWMKRQARSLHAAVAGSLIGTKESESGAGRFTNTFVMAHPDGRVETYDKRHLFGYGGETASYAAGRRRVEMQVGPVRLLPQVCYDLRFPVASRNRPAHPFDLMVYVASWPASRQNAWDTLLRARAIENQCYVAGVNRVGTDVSCCYVGGSVLVDPYGQVLLSLRDEAGIGIAELDLERLKRFREKFPALADADDFELRF